MIGGISLLAIFMPLLLHNCLIHLNSVDQSLGFWAANSIGQGFSLYYMFKHQHRLVRFKGHTPKIILEETEKGAGEKKIAVLAGKVIDYMNRQREVA